MSKSDFKIKPKGWDFHYSRKIQIKCACGKSHMFVRQSERSEKEE